MSLRLRLLLTLAPLFILGLVAAFVATYVSLQSFLISRVDQQLQAYHRGVESCLQGGPGCEGGPPGGGGSALPSGTWAVLLNSDGSVAAGPVVCSFGGCKSAAGSTTHPNLPTTLQPGPQNQGATATVDGTGTSSRYRLYVELSGQDNNFIYVLAAPLDDVDSTLNRLLVLEIAITGAVTLVVLVATWFIVRQGLSPLERMGRQARSIVASDLSRRVTPATDKTEVGRLGLALNAMLSKLEQAFSDLAASETRLRHFVADASHELRTPLTSMRGYAELLRRKPDMEREDVVLAIKRVEDEAQRMGVLVDDLLLLARLDQGRPLERNPVDLESLVLDACSDARAADPGRVITPKIAAPLTVIGDDVRLRQALGNLLRNAVVHTPAGTPVEVELKREGDRAVVNVIDHGPGIPAGHLDRVFERFHRADPGRSRDQGGSGLGLSITAAIIGAHGGGISVSESPLGGATFRIELPLATVDEPAAPEEPRVEIPSNL